MLALSLCMFCAVFIGYSLRPYRLRVEYKSNPIGLDVEMPRFYWAVDDEGIRGDIQTAYQIQICNAETNDMVADTNKIKSNESSQILINNFSISNQEQGRYAYTIQLWNKSDTVSITATNYFETSLISQKEWNNASWIGIPSSLNPNKTDGLIMNQFRTEFYINSTSSIQNALCYIVSPNYYTAYLNGILTDNHLLGAFTQFEYTTYYEMINCKNQLKINTQNVLGITLGNGRYSEPSMYLGAPMVKVIIAITFSDGKQMNVYSNNLSWYQGYGPIRMNDIYRGEWYDATKETDGWLNPNYNYKSKPNWWWTNANIIDKPVIGDLKSSSIMPTIQKLDSFTALSITNPGPNIYVFDFGQNVAGICELFVAGNQYEGHNITMIHSEQLDEAGFVVQLYGKQNEIATYTLRGDGNNEVFMPSFTYFGYQYVQMEIPNDVKLVPSKESLTSYFIHTAFDYIGSIQFGPAISDNANLLNTIESMTRYSSMSNYMNIPTDCPQRERYGYLGDGQLSSDTVIYHWDIASSYTKWLWDIHDTQIFVNGSHNIFNTLPDSSPYFFHGGGQFPGDIAWTAAYINLVHQMWKYYGDTRLINIHYEGMKKLLLYYDNLRDSKTNLLPVNINVSRYGDWCAVPVNTSTVGLETDGTCPHESSMLNTCVFAKDCLYLSELAAVIGNQQDSKQFYDKYVTETQAIYDGFWNKEKGYFEDNNHNVPLNQTAPFSTLQALALDAGVLSNETEIKSCVNAMVNDITTNGKRHLYEGIIGIKYILKELCENGQCLFAMNATLQKGYPSYDYWITNGATTLWEEWKCSRYDNHGGSKNHIMFGTQSAWYFQYLAGIRQQNNSINWKQIIIDPFVNITVLDVYNIEGEVDTICGIISVSLSIDRHQSIYGNNTVWETLKVSIPSGSMGMVYFRRLAAFGNYIDLSRWIIKESNIVIWQNGAFVDHVDAGILNGVAISDDALAFNVESGQYSFSLITN